MSHFSYITLIHIAVAFSLITFHSKTAYVLALTSIKWKRGIMGKRHFWLMCESALVSGGEWWKWEVSSSEWTLNPIMEVKLKTVEYLVTLLYVFLILLNGSVILSSCGSRTDCQKFRLTLLKISGREPFPQITQQI